MSKVYSPYYWIGSGRLSWNANTSSASNACPSTCRVPDDSCVERKSVDIPSDKGSMRLPMRGARMGVLSASSEADKGLLSPSKIQHNSLQNQQQSPKSVTTTRASNEWFIMLYDGLLVSVNETLFRTWDTKLYPLQKNNNSGNSIEKDLQMKSPDSSSISLSIVDTAATTKIATAATADTTLVSHATASIEEVGKHILRTAQDQQINPLTATTSKTDRTPTHGASISKQFNRPMNLFEKWETRWKWDVDIQCLVCFSNPSSRVFYDSRNQEVKVCPWAMTRKESGSNMIDIIIPSQPWEYDPEKGTLAPRGIKKNVGLNGDFKLLYLDDDNDYAESSINTSSSSSSSSFIKWKCDYHPLASVQAIQVSKTSNHFSSTSIIDTLSTTSSETDRTPMRDVHMGQQIETHTAEHPNTNASITSDPRVYENDLETSRVILLHVAPSSPSSRDLSPLNPDTMICRTSKATEEVATSSKSSTSISLDNSVSSEVDIMTMHDVHGSISPKATSSLSLDTSIGGVAAMKPSLISSWWYALLSNISLALTMIVFAIILYKYSMAFLKTTKRSNMAILITSLVTIAVVYGGYLYMTFNQRHASLMPFVIDCMFSILFTVTAYKASAWAK
jgi:hypothetical protein